jgi:hypothetical protein
MIADEIARARELVQVLLSAGLTHAGIAEKLGGRVSTRTVYRWAKGENAPQRRVDRIALEQLAQSLPAA